LVSLLAAACSSSTGDPASTGNEASAVRDEAPASNEPAASDGEQLLNRVNFRDLQLSFYWMGPGSIESQQGQIGIEELFGSVDYVGALRKEYGSLTALELFKAFAPADIQPHPALIVQQEPEARAYGRVDDDLEARDIDAHALSIEKAIPANCESTVASDASPLRNVLFSTQNIGLDGTYFFLCSTQIRSGVAATPNQTTNTPDVGCAFVPGHDLLTVGICNDTASVDSAEFWTAANDARGNRFVRQRTSVAPGQVGRFDALPLAPPFQNLGRSLAVISRNSVAHLVNAHRQVARAAE
jgi:hypothetical protein